METLRVGAAFPDPPFNDMDGENGLDVALMAALTDRMGMRVEFVHYDGADFNGIFDALNAGAFDCATSGTTVTSERETKAAFCPPYLISGQWLVVDTTRLPHVRSTEDLDGLTIGVQQGNTSQPIANDLVAQGKAARVRVYDYGSIRTALVDLTTGGCDAFMKLAPVLTELVRPIDGVEVVQRGISVEDIAIAVATVNQALLSRLTMAQAELEDDGTLPRIRQRWLGNPAADQSAGAGPTLTP
jgi:polar amino acid transport system substrate-binding protein